MPGAAILMKRTPPPVGGYVTEDATLGYSFGATSVSFEGTNLSNQRPPVTASEFGSQSFYLLPARMLWLRARIFLALGPAHIRGSRTVTQVAIRCVIEKPAMLHCHVRSS